MDDKNLKKWIKQQKLEITKGFYALVRSGDLSRDCAKSHILQGEILMLERLEAALKEGEIK